MRNVLASSGSRKRLNVDFGSVQAAMSTQRHKPALLPNLVHNKSGVLHLGNSAVPQSVVYSSASFNANDLSSDHRILEVGDDHILSALLKSKTSARGGNYLRQHLYQEMLAQRRKHPGDIALALQNSIAELNNGFQNLHPFNLDILQGIQVVIAFADFSARKVHVASNGGCRCILGKSIGVDAVEIIADVGRNEEMHDNDIALISNVADLQLDTNIDFMILGSTGFWKEVAPVKAVLRAHYFFHTAPSASNSSAAASLINYSLHCVTQRMKAHSDRRMVSLNSVSNLVSLQAGNRGQFKYGHKQPVRRRRGDVHDDITALVTMFDWQGQSAQGPLRPRVAPKERESKWAVVRMAFRFHIASSNHNTQEWQKCVSGVLMQLRECQAKNESVSLLKNAMHSESSRSSGDSYNSTVTAL